MHCPQCQHENREGARFCEACGSQLELRCPACRNLTRPGAAFCDSCGTPLTQESKVPGLKSKVDNRSDSRLQTLGSSGLRTADPGLWTPPHLAERIRAEQAALEARGVTDGERKTITALFADIKGSMELIENLDPEQARNIIDPALRLMTEAIRRYGGHVVQSTGDGIFAIFGAPIAHEDHVQRALYAALRMQDELNRYSARMGAEGSKRVQARVGINTGEAVVRS